jgi:tetratricopeptide (TPR) repeat protein
MSEGAIFYGGTDPGRFVPTYMIYSAKVREDVFLITQNALADNTYMNVMRDLYGDSIWIPSTQDSNAAFQKYVKDVNEGKVKAGAAVTVKDGRVSVQGVAGVMMINGILARKIFEQNKHKHDFYVEESYVIPWMYPYMEPHGLIMKINKKPITITPKTIDNDRQFWDWYTERLLSDNGFIRDIVARKTFSKLRSAIAGVYAYRRNVRQAGPKIPFDQEAIYAFKQAIDLYPLSPEANFRLADIYMQTGKFKEAKEVIGELVRLDPGNDRVGAFLNQIIKTEAMNSRRAQLESIYAAGSGDVQGAIELIKIYRKMNSFQQFEALFKQVVAQKQLPPELYLMLAKEAHKAKRLNLVERAYTFYTRVNTQNPEVWLNLGAVQLARGKTDKAVESLKKSVKLAGKSARDAIAKDPRFAKLQGHPEIKKLLPQANQNFNMNLPGFK